MKKWAKVYADEKQAHLLAAYLKAHHLGVEHATTNAALSKLMGMDDIGAAGRKDIPNSIKLTNLFKVARKLGYPIAADVFGVYYARTKEEALRTANENYSRAETYREQGDLMSSMAMVLPLEEKVAA